MRNMRNMQNTKTETMQERQQAILMEIIQFYLESQEAISARTLSKFSRLALSPTTIRNLMEDLSLDGYLTSQGVSRGRIPTQKAFTIYVSTVRNGKLPQPAPQPAPRAEDQLLTLAGALQKTGSFLAEQSGFIALAALPEKDAYPLDWVRLVHISEERMLVAVQSLYGDLWSKVIPVLEHFPPEVLKEVEWHICRNYHGQPMENIRRDIMSGEPKELLEQLPSMGAAFRLLRKSFDWDKSTGWHVWGTENLYSIREYQQPGKMVQLHKALDDPGLIEAVLRNAREVDGGRVAIGTETGYTGLEDSAVVGYSFGGEGSSGVAGSSGGWRGTIALLGPMRMDYALVFSLMSQAARQLDQDLQEIRLNASSPCA